MRIAIHNLARRLNGRQTLLDVEEELQFHLDMLERKYAQAGMCPADAKAAAFKCFGNLERVKRQCVAIGRRNTLLRRIHKTVLILIGITGLAIQILSSDLKVARIGGVLIMIAISGRLLLFVRGLIPSSSAANREKRECL